MANDHQHLPRLLDGGFLVSQLARATDASHSTAAQWLRGSDIAPEHERRLATLAEISDRVAALHLTDCAAAWLAGRLPDSRYDSIDVIAAGHPNCLLRYIEGRMPAEVMLDRAFTEWREDDAFVPFTAGDGQRALRPKRRGERMPPPLAGVTPDHVVRALERCGWSVAGEHHGVYRRLQRDNPPAYTGSIVVPSDTNAADYEDLMNGAILSIMDSSPEAMRWIALAGDPPAHLLTLVEDEADTRDAFDADSLGRLIERGTSDMAGLTPKDVLDVAERVKNRAAVLRRRAVVMDEASFVLENAAANGMAIGARSPASGNL